MFVTCKVDGCITQFKPSFAVQEYQLPEVLRTSLEQLCLTVKANMGTVMPSSQSLAATLAQMLSPPPSTAVRPLQHPWGWLQKLESCSVAMLIPSCNPPAWRLSCPAPQPGS